MINRRYLFHVVGLGLILILATSVYYLVYRSQPKSSEVETILATQAPSPAVSNTPTSTEEAPTEVPVATLPPPLANAEFPKQPVDYLPGWPDELRYPEQFSVVETGSGLLPGASSTGWTAKLRYSGDPTSASNILSSFFRANRWQIVEHIELDSGGFLILVERNIKESTGIIVIDPDPNYSEYTNIITTIFP